MDEKELNEVRAELSNFLGHITLHFVTCPEGEDCEALIAVMAFYRAVHEEAARHDAKWN